MPRTETQNLELRAQRREEILQAALHVFARRGMVATKISDIAKEANLSHGLVYHYFQSKEEIFTLLVQRAADSSVQIIEQAYLRDGSSFEKIKWMTEQILHSLAEEQQILLFLIMIQASTSDAIPEEVKQFLTSKEFKSPVHCLMPLIMEGQQHNEIIQENPLQLAVSYYAFIQGFAINKLQWAQCPLPEAASIMKIFQ
ncbi:TetR/AcrR family transcriptional regulator [Lysinibacillus macroides]|uniref:TetR/AcrR family transcriptional regulator n=1 Tax=Lysinibacillus macroides TaxID=33935 RepID=UPI0006B641DE|nr:TetR/AcrR family transcriptional regulator [Lysinibacillus macroides]QPR69332.1 TetR/AcrR family transcriptional regulator [Lysinibacillus macroides]